ncbi:1,4-dihydroxy-2-naphthoate octaprenyltransferase [Corallococcus interemptor]|uniref:1,4-dihydroxy-2-naphthoate octaprenyltransferase n=1 Tax=Corallococcus TaxID=83461 RepID=UPI001CBBD297|nr:MULTISPECIES: 1,4-dihydroxy-2-naphthoate octaprenyltransferase [unclassified Corallococcus]MBZ4332945.1 1,4-dihydroxy-2-naphthoate octaprenyltransferase [Corallococcus sp. AS-1-12]MBZ4372506.1 1,4-dihydroxy-2-naphthoate octaprenyltransferase [Corallococcus sp. AS-1-6]
MATPSLPSSSVAVEEARPSLARVWWVALRPKTLTASIAPTLVGWAFANVEGGWRPVPALTFLVGFMLAQIVSNLVNDYSDFERGADTAARLGPARVTQKGWLSSREVAGAAALAFTGAALALLLLTQAGGWPVLAGGAVCLAGAVLYSAGPVPLGYMGLGDLLVLLISGLLGVTGSYGVLTHHLSGDVVLAGLSMGLIAAGILAVNNLRDRETDVLAGKRTLVVRFGRRFGQWEYTLAVAGAFALPLIAWALSPEHPRAWLFTLAGLPLAAVQIRAIWKEDGGALNPHLGRTAGLGLVFAVLLSAGLSL